MIICLQFCSDHLNWNNFTGTNDRVTFPGFCSEDRSPRVKWSWNSAFQPSPMTWSSLELVKFQVKCWKLDFAISLLFLRLIRSTNYVCASPRTEKQNIDSDIDAEVEYYCNITLGVVQKNGWEKKVQEDIRSSVRVLPLCPNDLSGRWSQSHNLYTPLYTPVYKKKT